jgi:hypothetical protein
MCNEDSTSDLQRQIFTIDLEATCRQGPQVRTNSDTEVIIHLYEDPAWCLDYLNGQFVPSGTKKGSFLAEQDGDIPLFIMDMGYTSPQR